MSIDTTGTAAQVRGIVRRYRSATALDGVTVSFEKDMIHGLLGRNGAGKTSLMSIVTGQDWPTEGHVEVFGQRPHENEQVLPRICFVREDQRATSMRPKPLMRSRLRPWPSPTGTGTSPSS